MSSDSWKVRAHGSQVAGRDGSRPRRKHAIELIMRLEVHDRRDHDDSLMIAEGSGPEGSGGLRPGETLRRHRDRPLAKAPSCVRPQTDARVAPARQDES